MAKKEGWQRGLGKYAQPVKVTEVKKTDESAGKVDISKRTFADNERGSHEIRGPKR